MFEVSRLAYTWTLLKTDPGFAQSESYSWQSTEYYWSEKIEKNERYAACGKCGDGQQCIQSFGEETEGKRQLERPRRRWEDGIKYWIGKELDWRYSV